jgi:hypothetical protein
MGIKYHPLVRSPHGHFYSPIVSKKDIQEFEDKIWENVNHRSINGID